MSTLSTGQMRDASTRKSLHDALKDDGRLSHEEVINLIRSTLDFGGITKTEASDLKRVADASRTIPARSKQIINLLVSQFFKTLAPGGNKIKLTQAAGDKVCDFLLKSGNGQFPNLDRDEVGIGLLMRLANPALIRQGSSSLCGPSSLLYNLATDKPLAYAEYATELYDSGTGYIGSLKISPGSDCRNYSPPAGAIDPVDWLTAASIRDSENYFFDYQSVKDEFAGITLPNHVAGWFEDAGYTDVKNETNLVFSKSASTIGEINLLQSSGYRVCLFIGANMLYSSKNTVATSTADHWVVLVSSIKRSGGNVNLDVFTWGDGKYEVPAIGKTLTETDFLKNLYGYVAAKP